MSSGMDPDDVRALIEQMNADTEYTAHPVGKKDVEFRLPPNLKDAQIDMSQMHMMDHSIWRCDGWGGRRQHARLRWTYQTRPAIGRVLLCPLGLHKETKVWKMRDGKPEYVQRRCQRCMRALGPKQQL